MVCISRHESVLLSRYLFQILLQNEILTLIIHPVGRGFCNFVFLRPPACPIPMFLLPFSCHWFLGYLLSPYLPLRALSHLSILVVTFRVLTWIGILQRPWTPVFGNSIVVSKSMFPKRINYLFLFPEKIPIMSFVTMSAVTDFTQASKNER